MMLIVILSLITFTTISDIESVSGEWTAPGEEISRETIVVFPDNGEMLQSEAGPYVGTHVCFLSVDGQEQWRATVVYRDRVILFQENLQPIETPHNFPVSRMSFSPDGVFVALFEKTDPEFDNNMNGLRINAENGEAVPFDSHPDGITPFISIVRNDGSITFSSYLDYSYHELNFLGSELQPIISYNVHNLLLPAVAGDFFISSTREGLVRYNEDGEVAWTSSGESQYMNISNNEKYYLFPRGNSEVVLGSTETGNIIRVYALPFEYTLVRRPIFLSDDSGWMASANGYNTDSPEVLKVILSGEIDSSIITYTPFPTTNYIDALIGSAANRLLFKRLTGTSATQREDTRFILLDDDLKPLFATECGTSQNSNEFAISSNYNRILFSDRNGINLVVFGGE